MRGAILEDLGSASPLTYGEFIEQKDSFSDIDDMVDSKRKSTRNSILIRKNSPTMDFNPFSLQKYAVV